MFSWKDNILLVNNFFSILLWITYEKKHIFKYEVKGAAAMVPFPLTSYW